MSYLRYLCLLAHSCVQHILCCVFVCLRIVYSMFPVSLDCQFWIAPLVILYVKCHHTFLLLVIIGNPFSTFICVRHKTNGSDFACTI